MKKSKKSVYEIVTERITKEMEKGIIPWQKPWFNAKVNYVTRRPYSGINLLLLSKTGEYLTWNQVQKLGGKVRKGAVSYMVTFFKRFFVDDSGSIINANDMNEDEEYEERFTLRYYNVFHLSDVEGIESKIPHQEEEDDKNKFIKAQNIAEKYLEREGIELLETEYNTQSYYNITADKIAIPLKRFFTSDDYYYQVLFHEMTHSMGHPKRLHRFENDIKKAAAFGSKEYSREELVAEIGSAFLMSNAGLTPTYKNSASYIKSWLVALNNDKRLIVSASAKAQKAAEFILGV